MNTFILIVLCFLANTFMGLIVFAAHDDDEGNLFKWFDSCPDPTGLMQIATLNFWPVFAFFWWRGR